jgi:putative sterol carrier protein
MSDHPDPGQIAEAVQGLSDDQLRAQMKDMGHDQILRGIFDGMREAFVPERAAGVSSEVQYDIAADGDTKHWTVAFDDGKCTTKEGPSPNPRLTLELDIVDFVRLILGQVEGPQLFMTGKLRLKGDMMFAMQMQSYFDRELRADT